MTEPATQPLEPLVVRNDEGEARWLSGALAEIKASAADTGGLMSIVEVTELPGTEAPLHVHHRDDEGFWGARGRCHLRGRRCDHQGERGRLRLRSA
jgi:hypothetical protein